MTIFDAAAVASSRTRIGMEPIKLHKEHPAMS